MPQPNFDKVFRPQLKHERTAPKPFSFEEKDKERWRKKESKIQDVYKEEEKVCEVYAGFYGCLAWSTICKMFRN